MLFGSFTRDIDMNTIHKDLLYMVNSSIQIYFACSYINIIDLVVIRACKYPIEREHRCIEREA